MTRGPDPCSRLCGYVRCFATCFSRDTRAAHACPPVFWPRWRLDASAWMAPTAAHRHSPNATPHARSLPLSGLHAKTWMASCGLRSASTSSAAAPSPAAVPGSCWRCDDEPRWRRCVHRSTRSAEPSDSPSSRGPHARHRHSPGKQREPPPPPRCLPVAGPRGAAATVCWRC